MSATTRTREVRFTTTRKGQRRAYRWDAPCMRWMPMPLATAELEVATGAAVEVAR